MPTLALVSRMSDEHQERCRRILGADWRLLPCHDQRDRLAAEGAEVVIVYGNVRPAELPRLPALRWIQATWAGVENLLTPEMIARDIRITNVRGMHATAMSEHAIAGLLYLARDLPAHLAANQSASWQRTLRCQLLADATVTIIGTGSIAAALQPRLAPLAKDIIGINSDGRPLPGYRSCHPLDALPTVLAESDFAVCLLPSTAQTRGLFDRQMLAACRPGCGLVNLSRGDLIDEPALLAALDSGQLGGAVLDVCHPEPAPADSRLYRHPRVLLTGHRSGSPRPDGDDATTFEHNLQCWISGDHQGMRCVVDPQRGY